MLVTLFEPTDPRLQGKEVRTLTEILPVRVLTGLGLKRRAKIRLKISQKLGDIEVALEALDVITFGKAPSLELAIARLVPLGRG